MKMLKRKPEHNIGGKEIFEVQPVILGGSPIDPKNKVILTREDHIMAVNYWNNIIRDLRKSKSNM